MCLGKCVTDVECVCMQMINFAIYRISPLLILYIACLLYLLLGLSTLFSLSVHEHARTHALTLLSLYFCLLPSSTLWYHLYSSCLRHPGKLNFVFNIVEFPACSGRPAGRRGLCTGGLFDLISSRLVLPANVKPSSEAALPKVMSGAWSTLGCVSWFAATVIQTFRCDSCH